MKLSQIKEMLSKISKWPWMNRYPYNAITDDKLLFVVGCNSCGTKNKEDLDFIASAPAIIDQLITKIELLSKASNNLLEMYLSGANSGDWGNWNPEEDLEVIQMRKALKEVERIENGYN